MNDISTKEILHVNKFYYPQVGGIEQVVQTISEEISSGYECDIIASQPRGLGYSGCHNGVKFTKTSSFGVLQSVPISPTFPIRFRQAAKNADILHHHLPNPLSTVSHLYARRSDIPTVVTYHSDIVRQSWALDIYEPIQRKFLNKVDLIIVTSRNLLQESELLNDFKHKCEIVPLSVEVDSIEQGTDYNIEPDIEGPVILFVGRLTYYKGIKYLIDAMNEVEGTLLIVGDGEQKSELQ